MTKGLFCFLEEMQLVTKNYFYTIAKSYLMIDTPFLFNKSWSTKILPNDSEQLFFL